jgi:DNA-binding MarR family transcriptional regulator
MTSADQPSSSGRRVEPNRDLFSLARADIRELLAALQEDETLNERPDGVPTRAAQIAGLIVAETIRLIRVGTRVQLAEAGDAIAQMLVRRNGTRLAESQPHAHELLSAASTALCAAVAPSSSGGEITVLRSWGEKSKRAVAYVSDAPDQAMPRSRLKERLGLTESNLSHMLAELEAAALIVRVRTGRTVTVHLGPAADLPHVRELLDEVRRDDAEQRSKAMTQSVEQMFKQVLAGEHSPSIPGSETIHGLVDIAKQLADVTDDLEQVKSVIENTVAERDLVVCHITISGTARYGPQEGAEIEPRELVWTARIAGEQIAVRSWSSFQDRRQAPVEPQPNRPETLPLEDDAPSPIAQAQVSFQGITRLPVFGRYQIAFAEPAQEAFFSSHEADNSGKGSPGAQRADLEPTVLAHSDALMDVTMLKGIHGMLGMSGVGPKHMRSRSPSTK